MIVGAGLSGIGAAHHLQEKCPGKSYVILEARDAIGGTWDLFRYPGIRSDSDMHTLGYNFKPWREAKAIADGPSILNYVNEAAADAGITKHIRFGHSVVSAAWSSAEAVWYVEIRRKNTGETIRVRCNFLQMCSGYYSYDNAYLPEFKSQELFKGTVVHPQYWPKDLNYKNKKVVIIGSGATAMTLAPNMAQDTEHLVMLQRSPTYVVSLPDRDRIANTLRRFLPEKLAYAITRWKNVSFQQYIYKRSRKQPLKMKEQLLHRVRKELGADYDVEKHFTPSYNPWDQRLCLLPNSDLFNSIKAGKTEIVTDHIEQFTAKGILLKSGRELQADIIVTATGLNLIVLGGVKFSVDGKAVNFADTVTYKGMMFSDVPNLIFTFGYINASWTLRADLTAEYVCRLLNHLDAVGRRQCTPRLQEADKAMPLRLWIDDFSAGYMQRMLPEFPRQGDREPWVNPQNYKRDKKMLRYDPVDDGYLVFDNPVQNPVSEVRRSA